MAKKRQYWWLVVPKGDVAHTNQVIAEILEEEVAGSSFCKGIRCEDGRYRDGWCIEREQAKEIWDSRDKLGIEIEVWGKDGSIKTQGKPRQKTFLFKPKNRRLMEPKKAKKQPTA